MDKFLRVLREFIPEFAWRVDTLHLYNYLLPHIRVRVFLRGIRRSILEMVPDPLPPFGCRGLRAALGNFRNLVRATLTGQQQQNLKDYEQLITTMYNVAQVKLGDLVVVALDRAKNRTYKMQVQVNRCPTLTTSNVYLFIMSVTCVVRNLLAYMALLCPSPCKVWPSSGWGGGGKSGSSEQLDWKTNNSILRAICPPVG